MYDGLLVADESVQDHHMEFEATEEDNADFKSSLMLIDTTGCEMYESLDSENGSKYNKGEASLVVFFIEKFMKEKFSPS